MKKYKRLKESNKKDLNELIGEFKGQYKTLKDVKKDSEFKKLSSGDKEYVLDELKAEGNFNN